MVRFSKGSHSFSAYVKSTPLAIRHKLSIIQINIKVIFKSPCHFVTDKVSLSFCYDLFVIFK